MFTTTFYLSPAGFTYLRYRQLLDTLCAYGWEPVLVWPKGAFHHEAMVEGALVTRVLNCLTLADIYIACLPGTASTHLEIGTAYARCRELFLTARDPVYFTQTGLADAYLALLPGARKVCCEPEQIPAMLARAYAPLVKNRSRAG